MEQGVEKIKEKISTGEIYFKILNGEIIDWYDISLTYECDDEFIDEFHNKLYWETICKVQKLSEYIIDKYSNEVNWIIFSAYQTPNLYIIEKYKNDLNWFWLLVNNAYNEDFLWKYRKYLPKDIILRQHQDVSTKFLKKLQDWRDQGNGSDMS